MVIRSCSPSILFMLVNAKGTGSRQSLPPPPLAAVVVVPDAHLGRPSLHRIDEAPLVPGQLRLAFGTGVVALDEVQPQSAVFGIRDVNAIWTP